jgi:hypothetical protein
MRRGQQTIVDGHVDHDWSERGQAPGDWRPDEIPHGVKARQRPLVQQQAEGELDFDLGAAGRQVQDPHIVAIGPLGLADAQRVIGTAEGQARNRSSW